MKKNLILLSLCVSMNSCVMDEEFYDSVSMHTPEKQAVVCHYNMNESSENQDIPDEAFSRVQFNIKNEIPNLYLIVEGIRICNVHLSGTYHFPTDYSKGYWETDTTKTSLTIETGRIELAPHQEFFFPQKGTLSFIPQTIRAWNPIHLPQDTGQSYLLLNCKIYNIHDTDKGYQEGQEALIWGNEKGNCAELAIPLSIHFSSNQTHHINIELSDDCPWYNINNDEPKPILVPITFDVYVEDWKNV